MSHNIIGAWIGALQKMSWVEVHAWFWLWVASNATETVAKQPEGAASDKEIPLELFFLVWCVFVYLCS